MRTYMLMFSLLVGCMKQSAMMPAEQGYYNAEDSYGGVPASPAPPPPPASMTMSRDRPVSEATDTRDTLSEGKPPTQAAQAPARKVHYTGYARLRVEQPEQSATRIIAQIKAGGGYVEQLYGTTLVLRVPVASFQDTFEALLKQGDVLSRSLSAEDLTEAYLAVDLRITSLKAMRERLINLLAQAKSEQEKIALVQQIQQVTEDLDQLQAQLRTLSSLADYSRITLELVEHVALASGPGEGEAGAFQWISFLSPFNRGLAPEGRPVHLSVPEGLVRLSKDPFDAESADGTHLRATRIPNAPRGDSAFWMNAISQRLSKDFASAERKEAGAYQLLRLQYRGDEPYVYVVGVRDDGKYLEIIEILYPSIAQEQRYSAAILAALSGGAS